MHASRYRISVLVRARMWQQASSLARRRRTLLPSSSCFALQATAALLVLLLAPHATALHEGDFVHTSRRSQYQQVWGLGSHPVVRQSCAAHRTGPRGAHGKKRHGMAQAWHGAARHLMPTHLFQMRTNWRDLTEHHCPRFGRERTVRCGCGTTAPGAAQQHPVQHRPCCAQQHDERGRCNAVL
jgi:hypothetical protein